MLGRIELAKLPELDLETIPEDAKKAWKSAAGEYVGATYKPLLYCGWQITHGINYFFIAKETQLYRKTSEKVVMAMINGGRIEDVEEIL